MPHPDRMKIPCLPALFCVADGIGGAAHGEVASRMVLDVFSRYFPVPDSSEEVSLMVARAKEILDGFVFREPSYGGFGTTIAGLILSPDHAVVFNCGDSRVYCILGSDINLLSHDHSLVQEMCDQGVITREQIYTHPYRNIITSSISGELHRPAPQVSVTRIPVTGTEWFLLCTDGVWEVVRDEELVYLCKSGSIEQAASDILATCLERGGPDNISLVLVRMV
jgi:protein phosphatase